MSTGRINSNGGQPRGCGPKNSLTDADALHQPPPPQSDTLQTTQIGHLFFLYARGFCPSCGARRMIESAAHRVDHVLPEQPIRQWVLTFPYPLRFLFAAQPQVMSQVLGVVYRAISIEMSNVASLFP